ncbi:MAG: autotransporter-associated beta strand repeat-containing protein [Opitutaceae bacterium]|jgi:autotransporter-associated beta strand protein|nr:autotransporter-associated beta strand repeat-containing protein [Opitutaceae bacterium]
MNNIISNRALHRLPRVRRLLPAAALPVVCALSAGLFAQSPVQVTGTRTGGLAITTAYGLSYEIAGDAVVTWSSVTNADYAVYDLYSDTCSWMIVNRGTVGAPANGASPYNGIYLKTTGSSTIINETTGYITTGLVTGDSRAAVNFERGWGYFINKGSAIGASTGAILGVGGVVENTGTIIGQNASRSGIWFVMGSGAVRNTGGYIEGGAYGIRMSAGAGAEIWNTGGGVINAVAPSGAGIIAGNASLSVTNDASGIVASQRGIYYNSSAGPGVVNNINGAVITGSDSGVYSYGALSLSNDATSLIEAFSAATGNAGIYMTNSGLLTLTNAGVISGGVKGISLGTLTGHSIVNEAGGVIKSIYDYGAPGTLTSGQMGAAISQSAASGVAGVTISNAGLIEGLRHGIFIGNEAVIINTGTIRATGATIVAAIYLSATNGADSLITLDTGSVLEGGAVSASVNSNRLVLRGSGAEAGNFIGRTDTSGFKSLTMEGDDWTLSGTISLTGTDAALRVATGTLSIAGDVFFRKAGGAAVVDADATLRIADGANLASATADKHAAIATAGSVLFDLAGDFDYNGNISGSGSVIKNGAGTVTLSGSNTHGDTTINAGTLQGGIGAGILTVNAGGAYDAGALTAVTVGGLAGEGVVMLGSADLVFNIAGAGAVFDFAGTITGGGQFIKTGSGALDLRQTLTFASTHIKEGSVKPGDAAKFGAGTLLLGGVTTHGLIDYDGAADWTKDIGLTGAGGGFIIGIDGSANFIATATGAGDFIKAGSGTLDITGATMNNTGNTVVEAGTLRGDTTTIKGDTSVAAGATVEFYQTSDGAYAGAITGAGALYKTGAGSLTLTGANTYGDTVISAGLIEGNIGAGTLTAESSGTYKMGAGSSVTFTGMLGNGTVDMNGNDLVFDVADGITGTFGFQGALGNGSDFIKTGAGTLDLRQTLALASTHIKEGSVRLDDAAKLGAGTLLLGDTATHGLIDYTGVADWTKNTGLTGAGGGFIIGVGDSANFTATAAGAGDFIKSGGGTLDITGATMNNTGNTVVEAGTLRGDATTIKGDTSVAADATVEFYQTSDGAYAGAITGTGALHKTGAGSLTLTGANTYGDTVISAGLIEGNIGAGTLTAESSGTYKMGAGSNVTFTGMLGNGTIDINGNDLVFDVADGITGTFGFQGALNNGNDFIKTGAGTLDLQQTLALASTHIKEGSVKLDDAAKLGAGALLLGDTSACGLIDYTGTADWTKDIGLTGAGGGFIIGVGGSANFTATAAGAGDFIKSGSGTLDITGATMNNTGNTLVEAGTLRGDATTIKGDTGVAADAIVEFYQTTDGAYAGAITGAGTLRKSGSGALTLTGANAHGDTVIEQGLLTGNISAGRLDIKTGGTYKVRDGQQAYTTTGIVGDGMLDLNQADLVFDIAGGSSVFNFSGSYTGAGGNQLIKTGAGTLDLQTRAALPGGAVIGEGVVRLASEDFLGAGVTLGGTTTTGLLEYTGSTAWAGALKVAGAGGGFTVAGGDGAQFTGTLSGDALFIKEGAGRLDATGATFANTGGMSVRSGTLAGAAHNIAAATEVLAGAVLEFAEAGDGVYAGALTGAGSLLKTGAGTLTLSQAVGYGGATTVREGILRAGAASLWLNTSKVVTEAAGAIDMGGFDQRIVNLANDGAIIFNAKVNGVAGVIYEMDSLQITGSATGLGKIRVNIYETSIDGAAWTREAVFFEISGSDAPHYIAETAGRHVSGAYDWVVTPSDDRKKYTLSADQLSPEVPAVGGIDAAGYLAGKASASGLSRRLLAMRAENGPHDFQFWSGGLWREDRLNDALYNHAQARTRGIQIGADWNNKKGSDRPATIGVFYDYAETHMDMDGKTSSTKSGSNGAGFYASYRPAPLYIDLLIRGSRENYDIIVPGMPAFSTEGTGIAVSIETGGVLPVDWSWNIEPQLQAMLQKHKVDAVSDAFDREYTIDGAGTIEGRFGVRLWREFPMWNGRGRLAPYIRPSLIYEWEGEGVVSVGGRSFKNHMGGSYGALDAGVSLMLGGHLLVSVDGGWYAGSKMNGYAVNAGLSLLW